MSIKFENTEVMGWEHAIRGMRNPMNSWDKSDSTSCGIYGDCLMCDQDNNCPYNHEYNNFIIGPNDLNLMTNLRNAGTDHRKFMRMITVYVDITAPLYWWKEFDTYKVGTVANSCSTMHKIADKRFDMSDFSHEHLVGTILDNPDEDDDLIVDTFSPLGVLQVTIDTLNTAREKYLETNDKKYWWQMIQLLPSSYNQKRTVQLNYEVLANIYKSRKNHKLDEWCEHNTSTCTMDTPLHECKNQKEYLLCEDCMAGKGFCDWIKKLPYSELITGEK